MLSLAALVPLVSLLATAAPVTDVKVVARSDSHPVSSLSLPIVAAVPRSERKSRQLQRHASVLRSSALAAEGRWVDDGTVVEFFGPGAGVEYAVNVTVAGQVVSVIFDTGR